jgi:hypothetical protein
MRVETRDITRNTRGQIGRRERGEKQIFPWVEKAALTGADNINRKYHPPTNPVVLRWPLVVLTDNIRRIKWLAKKARESSDSTANL